MKNNNTKALEYYRKAQKIAERIGNQEIICNIWNNKGAIYRIMGNYDKAIEFFKKSIDNNNDSKLSVANGLNNISNAYVAKKEYKNAQFHIEKANNIYKSLNNLNGIMLSEYNLADIFIRTHEFEDAEKLLLKAIEFYSKTDNLQMLKNSYFSMYELNKERETDSLALQYYEKYHEVEMKILTEKERKSIAEYEAKFELLQKDKQLKQMQKSNLELKNIHQNDKSIMMTLQSNRDFYELILENSYYAIIIINQFEIIYKNQQFAKMFEVENMPVKSLAEIFDEDSFKRIHSNKKAFYAQSEITKKYVVTTTTLKGKKQNLEINFSRFQSNDGVWLLLAHFEDVTELYKKEERLRLLIRAFEQSPTSIAITDHLGMIKYVNPEFENLTGYSLKEVINKNSRFLKSDNSDISYADLWKKISAGEVWSGNFYNKRKDGKYYWEHASISPVWDSSKNITHYIKISEDITEKKKIEDKINNLVSELKKSNASKDKFFSIIAHDLKSPFATILSFVRLMKKYYSEYSEAEILKLIDELDKGVKNVNDLIENLLNWSRLQAGRMQCNPIKLDLTFIINRTLDLYKPNADKKKISLEFDFPEQVYIYADKFMIETILRNLLNNALKFTPESGTITLGVKELDKFYHLFFKDTGVGIPPQNIQNLFSIDTSFSTKGTNQEKGTGLGLILCKEFIEKNKGEIWLESKVQEGTTFTLSIPKDNNTI